jgi:hypothetical protein
VFEDIEDYFTRYSFKMSNSEGEAELILNSTTGAAPYLIFKEGNGNQLSMANDRMAFSSDKFVYTLNVGHQPIVVQHASSAAGGNFVQFNALNASCILSYDTDLMGFNFTPTNSSLYIGSNSNYTHTLLGTWKLNSAEIATSDRNAKNSIQDIPDVYEALFDNLQSKIFKYNDGLSGRFHTGFEAQGVDEAIQKAGLTREDFAAVCIDNEGTEKESWGLRYDEFVSLNTWQIQKLKKRIEELEAKLEVLNK